MTFPQRVALLTFLITMMGLIGVVTNRHLDPPGWETTDEEMILAFFWATALSAGTFAFCWSCGVLAEWARLLPLPVASRESHVRRRIVALSLLLAITLMTVWRLPAEIQRQRAVDYRATPEELRRIYAEPKARDRIEVLAALANHRKTPSDVLLDLAITEDPDLDRPRWNLVALLQRPPSSVRQIVASHPATPLEGLNHLVDNGSQKVSEAIAWNPRTPPSALLRLAHHSSPKVLRPLTFNPKAPESVLEILAEHPDEQVRAGVAAHGETPHSLLSRLATDPSSIVRYRVATNSRTPLEALGLLVTDPDDEIRRLAQVAWDRRTGKNRE